VTLTKFGQPHGGIYQFAYTVPDIQAAIADYITTLSVGPWFVRGPFTPPEARYRGQPTQINLSLARAFNGHIQLELIQQHNDVASVYHQPGEARRYGFHHWARLTPTLDADIDRYRGLGYTEVFSDRLPTGARVVYVDATSRLPGMLELVELTAAQERAVTQMYVAALDWDGTDPVREG
jgi:Glyoxalase/Bleomycin resistance protein/Dioxygenase superfamily